MATRYWVGGDGLWSAANTANWSTSSGGSGGASVPTAADDVIFDANSGSVGYTVRLAQNTTVVNLTLGGISATQRLFLCSSVLGTARTLTATTVTASNLDLADIIGAGAASWNLSAISGGSGQCGGNGSITFTAATTCYWKHPVAGTVEMWSSSNWYTTSGGATPTRVPLPQDTAIFDANSFPGASCQVVHDVPRFGTVNWTGVTNDPFWDMTSTLGGVPTTTFGSVILDTGMNNSEILGYEYFTFAGRGTYQFKQAGRDVRWARIYFTCVGGAVIQQDNASFGVAGSNNSILIPQAGTWNCNSFTLRTTNIDTDVDGALSTTYSFTTGANITVDGDNTTGPTAFTVRMRSIATTTIAQLNITSSSANAITLSFTSTLIITQLNLTGNGSGAISIGATSINVTATTLNVTNSNAISLNVSNGVGAFNYGTIDLGTSNVSLTATQTVFLKTLVLSSSSTSVSGGGIFSFGQIASTITSNGVTNNLSFRISGGDLTFLDDFSSSRTFTYLGGTLNLNNFTVTLLDLSLSGAGAKTLNMGSSILRLTKGAGVVFNALASLTVNPGTSTIELTATTAPVTSVTFAGLSKTYYNLKSSAPITLLSGNNTFNNLELTSNTEFRYAAGSTQTIQDLIATGTSGNLITLRSTVPGTQWNIVKTSGTVNCNFINLRDSNASGGATFNAGANSNNQGNNTGWNFNTGNNNFFIMF